MKQLIILAFLLTSLLSPAFSADADWSHWMGPNRDGKSGEGIRAEMDKHLQPLKLQHSMHDDNLVIVWWPLREWLEFVLNDRSP